MNPYNAYLRAVSAALIAGIPLAACDQQGADQSSPVALFQENGQTDSPAQDDPSSDTSGPTDEHEDDAGSGDDSSSGDGSGDGTGGDDGGGTSNPEEDTRATTYTATLQPVQDQPAAGTPSGNATFSVSRDQFTANVRATGLAPGQLQAQHIHKNSRCPTPNDDTNRDGWVDAVEAGRVYGEILIPLDGDLSSQEDPAGTGASPSPSPSPTPSTDSPTEDDPDANPPAFTGYYGSYQANPSPSPTPAPVVDDFPTANDDGSLDYSESANLQTILNELRSRDPNPRDEFGRLGQDEPLALQSRVVEIHGVPPTTQLPPTVRSVLGLPAYLTLPVACGEIDVAPSGDTSPSPSPSPSPDPGPTPDPDDL